MKIDNQSLIPEDGSPGDTLLDSNVITSKKYVYSYLIISGGLHEWYHRAEKPIVLNRKQVFKGKRFSKKNKRSEEYKKRTRTRAFHKIRRLIYANFGVGSKFLTLTFSDNNNFDIKDLKTCNNKLSTFIKKLRKINPDLKYLVKPEFQTRGAVHYHLVTDIDYIYKKELEKLWGFGFIDIRAVKTEQDLGPYLTKYLSKDADDIRFKRNKRYSYSSNMNKPKKYYFDEVDKFIVYISKNNIEPNFESSFRNEYSGLTYHKEFHLTAPFDRYGKR